MNLTKILSIVFLIGSVGLAWYLGSNIKETIDERELIATREQAVIEKLMLIREAEIVYQEVNGNYTSNWDKLIDFIENGRVPIVEKKETIITLSYGADSVIVTYDTLEIVTAREKIFKASYNVNAANNGKFMGFKADVGDRVNRGDVAYELNQSGKVVGHKFKDGGRIVSKTDISNGASVTKGDLLMTIEESKFSPDIDLSRLSYVPGYDNVQFDIFADEIEKGNVFVDVIEVKNPRPFDRSRTEDSEFVNRRPLRFGSKTNVTTSGNWE